MAQVKKSKESRNKKEFKGLEPKKSADWNNIRF
jgi:hypothetical protein